MNEELTQQVLQLRSKGMRFSDIGATLGIHRAMATRIVYKARRVEVRDGDDESGTKMLRRLMDAVRVTKSGCWEADGYQHDKGHTTISVNGKNKHVHRAMFELVNGPIPKGMCICHTCDNPPCINPKHLWLGTRGENTADMHRKRRSRNVQTTHCFHGHEYTPENTYRCPAGKRHCRECGRIRDRKKRELRSVDPS